MRSRRGGPAIANKKYRIPRFTGRQQQVHKPRQRFVIKRRKTRCEIFKIGASISTRIASVALCKFIDFIHWFWVNPLPARGEHSYCAKQQIQANLQNHGNMCQ
jgi:hypothetical protein